MNAYFIAFLAMVVASLAVLGATGIPVLRRALATQRRMRALQDHPTLLALLQAQNAQSVVTDVQAKVEMIRSRSVRIGEAIGELLATSALLRLQVDRVSFATKLLLQTFVPTLRGSMSD